ncbi:response regulator transcription factor [Actinoplanes sp. L3-i22]|uniref:response regulator n=1 Tax=Actinoplanes sp. L3-i22 TaxID=2836373 RepID=UPI001C75CDC0|nr:response regulator transcription factor [Actinoplanes sp. L3-i22]BCY09644.1 DNA-binding response regulator [Actinoplanes sp. L3-i22]
MSDLRVLLADDHPVFLAGMRQLVDATPGLTVAAEATSGTGAVAAAEAHSPDVAVLDLHMPGLSGVEATRAITTRNPEIGVVILTMLDDDDSLFAAMRAGAKGYLLKGAGPVEVAQAIVAVGAGAAVFGPGIAHRLIDYFATPARASAEEISGLTAREREILELVADGHSNATIAERLFLSPKTVRNHVSNIFAKLHVADRAQAMLRARRAGLGS